MAKGVEDTAFYVYNRLISLNEVGGDPDRFGVRPEALHAYNQERRAAVALCALTAVHSRHQAQRGRPGPDQRSFRDPRRLECVGGALEPHERTAPPAGRGSNRLPTPMRSICSTRRWSAPGLSSPTLPKNSPSSCERIQAYMLKALREAKVHSSWINPDPDYDKAVQEFVASDPRRETEAVRFLKTSGRFSGVSATLACSTRSRRRCSSWPRPACPDTYQGTELWDFSLVDPDNRRPVDYPNRAEMSATAPVGRRGLERRHVRILPRSGHGQGGRAGQALCPLQDTGPSPRTTRPVERRRLLPCGVRGHSCGSCLRLCKTDRETPPCWSRCPGCWPR